MRIHEIGTDQPQEPSAEALDDQRLLQEALLATPHALDGWLKSVVWVELEELGVESPHSNGESFLPPVLDKLPPRPRKRFADAMRDGTFFDETVEFHASFRARLRLIDIGHMSSSNVAISQVSSQRTRPFRVVLGYEIGVDDFTAAEIEACYVQQCRRWAEEYPEHASLGLRAIPSTQELEDQSTLKRHLLASPHTLDEWFRNLILIDLDAEGAVEGVSEPDVEGGLLMPVIESLPARARHRFREAVSRRRLVEAAEEFWDSFDVQIRSIDVQGLGS